MKKLLHLPSFDLRTLPIIGALLGLLFLTPTSIINAQTQACPSSFSVQPDRINNASANNITVFGAAFSDETWVEIVNSGVGRLDPLPGELQDDEFVIAVPPGIAEGRYDVRLYNVNGDQSCTLGGALRIDAPSAPNPTSTPEPTGTPPPTQFSRPLVLVPSYGGSSPIIVPGQGFEIQVNLQNQGQLPAINVVVTFIEGDFEPRITGGVLADTFMEVGEFTSVNQILTVSPGATGETATLEMQLDYTDEFGNPYTETFRLVFDLNDGSDDPAPTETPTPTPEIETSQLIIGDYTTSADLLQPGTVFDLVLNVTNQGSAEANAVTMIVGGGEGTGSTVGGTPIPGGVAGASGSFDVFSPVGTSNVQRLGDIAAGGRLEVKQSLVVNVATQPGAYPLTVSFTYTDESGNTITDDQVITLLVFQPPVLDVSFYRTVPPVMVGEPVILPIQLVNLGSSSVTLGNLTVSAEDAQVENPTILVGVLDTGSFFTQDVTVIPQEAGPLDVRVTISYIDDFNQQRSVEQVFTVEVEGMPTPIPMEEGTERPGGPAQQQTGPETLGQVILRFIRGLLGLDSTPPEIEEPEDADSETSS